MEGDWLRPQLAVPQALTLRMTGLSGMEQSDLGDTGSIQSGPLHHPSPSIAHTLWRFQRLWHRALRGDVWLLGHL